MPTEESKPKPNRRSMRLQSWDYAQSAGYFVTTCVEDRACLLGNIANDETHLQAFGNIVQKWWDYLPTHFPNIELDAFVIMPNHIHAIIVIATDNNRRDWVPLSDVNPITNVSKDTQPLRRFAPRGKTGAPIQPTLSQIVAYFKYQSTKEINGLRGVPGKPFWQKGFHDRIIRNQRELDAKRKYIEDNPMQWALDEENPDIRTKRNLHEPR